MPFFHVDLGVVGVKGLRVYFEVLSHKNVLFANKYLCDSHSLSLSAKTSFPLFLSSRDSRIHDCAKNANLVATRASYDIFVT